MLQANDLKLIINAVHGRERYVQYLIKRLPGAIVNYDRNEDAIDTFIDGLCLLKGGPGILFEDDAILCVDFLTEALKWINRYPDRLIQFMSTRGSDPYSSAGERTDFAPNVCVYWPEGEGEDCIRYYAKTIYQWTLPKKDRNPDTLINKWLINKHQSYIVALPNLADHRPGESVIEPGRISAMSLTFSDPDYPEEGNYDDTKYRTS